MKGNEFKSTIIEIGGNLPQPFLSIVIPTYNRCKALLETIQSIITQQGFDDSVEILISDNCSVDGTQEALEKFAIKELHYIRREENIGADNNFLRGIEDARGVYIKLHNDNKPFMHGSLMSILCELKNNAPAILLTPNKARYLSDYKVARSIDEFVEMISYNCTWLGAICFLKSAWLSIDDKEEGKGTFLIQTYFLFRIMEKFPYAILDNSKYYLEIPPSVPKGGYNLFLVFGKNYLDILRLELDNGEMSYECFNIEKNRMLLRYILPMRIRIESNPEQFITDLSDRNKHLKNYYSIFDRSIFQLLYFLKRIRLFFKMRYF